MTWKHILLLAPDEKDATSFYRCWGPFSELVRTTKTPIMLSRASHVAWSTLLDKHLLMIQRPCFPNHLKVLEMAHQANPDLVTWVDWDDLLWQIPEGNPAKKGFGDPKVLYGVILRCVQQADIVTVSTPFFQRCFPEELQAKITVLRNRLPRHWRRQTPHCKPTQKRVKIAWRGSATHIIDWMEFLEAAITLSTQQPIEWVLIGSPPYHVMASLRRVATVTCIEEIAIEQYGQWFIHEGPQADILFVPLHDNAFNRVKSHIAMLEATFAGMLSVAPKWEEWTTGIPGADRLLYTNPDQAFACLERAIAQARQGAFTLVADLQTHFLAQFHTNDTLFHQLAFTTKGDLLCDKD